MSTDICYSILSPGTTLWGPANRTSYYIAELLLAPAVVKDAACEILGLLHAHSTT